MSEEDRHEAYKEAQDMAWEAILNAEDYRSLSFTTSDRDGKYAECSGKEFARASAWAAVAVALHRDGA